MSPALTLPRIDPPSDGDLRCRHEMLRGKCSWCKGLRDVPIDFGGQVDETPAPPRRWVDAERAGECASCGELIKVGAKVAWSPELQGSIGRCCEEAA